MKKTSKRFSVVTITTFLLGTIFFISVAPLAVFGATATRSAGAIFQNVDNQTGLLPNTTEGLIQMVIGIRNSEATTSSSDGSYNPQYSSGALQAVSNFSQSMYESQPASFIVWAQDQYYQMKGGLSFTAMAAIPNPNETSSYSPGIGYNLLQPIIGLWEYSRNIVYGIYIIILIVLAFVIMLRRPLGGQELVTIANSIPSLIVSIVLVTFSYPICGLFIDAVYLGSNLGYNLLFGSEGSPGYSTNQYAVKYDSNGVKIPSNGASNPADDPGLTPIKNVLQPDDPQMNIWSIMNLSGSGICGRSDLLAKIGTTNSVGNECSLSMILPQGAKDNAFGKVIDKVLATLTSAKEATGLLVELILALAVFQTALKLFFSVLNSYLTLSIYPIVAPFVFLGAALPNNLNKTLDGFFKTLGAAALNLIAIYVCFLLLVLFGQTAAGSSTGLSSGVSEAGQIKWIPPLLGYTSQQISDANSIQNNGSNIITTLLIFGLYMAIPNISDMVKKFLEVTSPFQQLSKTTGDITNVGKQALGAVGTGAKLITGKLFPG